MWRLSAQAGGRAATWRRPVGGPATRSSPALWRTASRLTGGSATCVATLRSVQRPPAVTTSREGPARRSAQATACTTWFGVGCVKAEGMLRIVRHSGSTTVCVRMRHALANSHPQASNANWCAAFGFAAAGAVLDGPLTLPAFALRIFEPAHFFFIASTTSFCISKPTRRPSEVVMGALSIA